MPSGNLNDDIGLRSSEVREVMNRVPPAILRWGITVIALIAAMGIGVATYVEIPVTTECDFTLSWGGHDDTPEIIIEIPAAAIQDVMAGGKSVMLSAEAFPGDFGRSLPATITHIATSPAANGCYQATAVIGPEMASRLRANPITIAGTASLTIGHQPLLRIKK